MAEQSANSNQQVIVIGLVVVAVLLAAIVGVMLYQNSKVPAPDAAAVQQQQQAQAPAGGGTQGQQQTAPVDPKKAVKLPASITPKQWVEEYYTAADKGDYATAVKHLPADKQATTTPQSLKDQLAGYGITGFEVTDAQTQGNTTKVVATQKTKQYGTFENTWTFQKVGNEWAIVGKAVTGMSQ